MKSDGISANKVEFYLNTTPGCAKFSNADLNAQHVVSGARIQCGEQGAGVFGKLIAALSESGVDLNVGAAPAPATDVKYEPPKFS